MRYFEIVEDASADITAADTARAAYHLFARHVNSHGFGYDFGIEGQNFFGTNTELCGIETAREKTMILVGENEPRTIGVSGAVWEVPVDKWEGCSRAIVIHCTPTPITPKIAKEYVNTVNFMRAFKHEFLHLLDIQRAPRIPATKNKDGMPTSAQDYYNCDGEFNAYYTDIMSNWATLGAEADHCETSEEIRAIADIFYFSGDFLTDLDRAVSHNLATREFVKWLRDDRRKRLLKRLYTTHHEICTRIFKD